MLRRLFTTGSAISLILCVISAALWVRSYRQSTEFVWPTKQASDGYHPNLLGASWRGQVAIARFWETSDHGGKFALQRFAIINDDLDTTYDWDGILQRAHAHWGFAAAMPPITGSAGEFVIAAPCWFLTLAFASMPCGWAVLGLRRRRRAQLGQCATCGYDLRASKDRCPECGTPIAVLEITGAAPATDCLEWEHT